jgi:hypothetical protein
MRSANLRRAGITGIASALYLFGQGQSARQAAPVDLTGTWVSVVTEDWRYRMVTPKKGDYPSIPLNAEGKKAADAWDGVADSCKAFGAGNIMRQPGRIRITWDGDNALKVETDAGTQTRVFSFAGAASGAGTLQGEARASWDFAGGRRAKGGGGSLKVVSTKMLPGFLQSNGVPYSANAVVTEYIHRTQETNGDSWLIVTTLVEDPQYLTGPFQRSTHFKKIADGQGWSPTSCVP